MPGPVVYWIDDADRIVRVNEEWTAFAMANGAPELTPAFVCGRPFEDFVTDSGTRHLYGELVRRVRTGSMVKFALRCDSPGMRRHLAMTMAPDGPDVCCTCTTVSVEVRSPERIWDRQAPRSDALVRACGWCKRLDVAGTWMEVEQGLPALGLFERDHPPMLTHGICPSCLERALTAL